MNSAPPMNIGCISPDSSLDAEEFSRPLANLESSGLFRRLNLTVAYDESLDSGLKCDVLFLAQIDFSERAFSMASYLRSLPQHALRPLFLMCKSQKFTEHAHRAKALGLETFSDWTALTESIRTLQDTKHDSSSDLSPHPLTLQRLFDTRDFPTLMKLTQKIGDNQRGSAHARAFEALLWLQEDNTARAEQLLRRGVSEQPELLPMRYLLSRVLARQGKYPDAQRFLEQHTHFPFLETISLLGLARLALEHSDHVRAESYFSACQQRDDRNPQAELGLGKIAFARGELEKASEHFVRAGHCDELASYFNQMAIALVNQRRFNDALFIYQNALKVLPSRDKHHFIHYNIGLAQKKRGALLEAADSFATSLSLSPGYEKAQQSLKEVLKLAATSEGKPFSFEKYKKLLAETENKN